MKQCRFLKDAAEDDNLDALDMNELDQLAGNIRDEEGDDENDDYDQDEVEKGHIESFGQEEPEQVIEDLKNKYFRPNSK